MLREPGIIDAQPGRRATPRRERLANESRPLHKAEGCVESPAARLKPLEVVIGERFLRVEVRRVHRLERE